MKSKEEIIAIAKRHLMENPFPNDDYEWVLKDTPIERERDYYFEYAFRAKKGLPPEQWETYAGAPGFCVNKLTGTIRDVDWDEYQDIITQ